MRAVCSGRNGVCGFLTPLFFSPYSDCVIMKYRPSGTLLLTTFPLCLMSLVRDLAIGQLLQPAQCHTYLLQAREGGEEGRKEGRKEGKEGRKERREGRKGGKEGRAHEPVCGSLSPSAQQGLTSLAAVHLTSLCTPLISVVSSLLMRVAFRAGGRSSNLSVPKVSGIVLRGLSTLGSCVDPGLSLQTRLPGTLLGGPQALGASGPRVGAPHSCAHFSGPLSFCGVF